VKPSRAIDPALFSWPCATPALLGGRTPNGEYVFPYRESAGLERVELSRQGILWSWTVQRFEPKSPPYHRSAIAGEFIPFALGFVELSGQIRVQTRLIGDAPYTIGMPARLEIIPLYRDREGVEVMTYAFRPGDF